MRYVRNDVRRRMEGMLTKFILMSNLLGEIYKLQFKSKLLVQNIMISCPREGARKGAITVLMPILYLHCIQDC